MSKEYGYCPKCNTFTKSCGLSCNPHKKNAEKQQLIYVCVCKNEWMVPITNEELEKIPWWIEACKKTYP